MVIHVQKTSLGNGTEKRGKAEGVIQWRSEKRSQTVPILKVLQTSPVCLEDRFR